MTHFRMILGGLLASIALPVTAQDADLFQRLDKNEDGAVTRDEVSEAQVRLFERLLRTQDKNEDGRLSPDEFQRGLQEQPDPAPAAAEGIRERMAAIQDRFRQLDADQDGKLTLGEIPEERRADFRTAFERLNKEPESGLTLPEFARLAVMLQQRRESPMSPQDMFRAADKNGDGKLSLDEVPEARREAFLQALDRLDSDGDRALTYEQFAQVLGRGTAPNPPGVPRMEGMIGPSALLLRVLDRDSNGEISEEEIKAAAESLAELDRNQDGKLEGDEIMPRYRPGAPDEDARGPALNRFFNFADKDGDGQLSKEEAPQFLQGSFTRFDTNQDGKLSREELQRQALGSSADRRPRDDERSPDRPQDP